MAAACLGALRAGDAPRPLYRMEAVAGSANIGDGGPAATAQLTSVQGIAVDRWGNLYISDTDRHRVRKVNAFGLVSTLAGTGACGFSGDGGPAAGAQLNLPYGLAVDLAGYVYIADLGNQRVRRVAPDGTIVTIAGNGRKASGPDGGPAIDSPLLTPRNVAVDAAGNLYISEFEGHRVRRVAPDGKLSTVAGTGVAGFRGDGGPASVAQVGFPAGLAVDRSGAVLVADSQNQRVRRIVPGGVITTVIGGAAATALATPLALTVDWVGTIYVADSSNIVRSYSAGGAWSNVAGTGTPGFAGDGGPARSAQVSAVRDLAADGSGNLYVADGVRVRRVDGRGIIQTTAGDGYLHAVGDGLSATAALLSQPMAVALDAGGSLYIADSGTNRIRQVMPNGTIRTLAGTGFAGPGPDSGPALGSALHAPMGVAAGSGGSVTLADTFNHRVSEVAPDGRIRTVAGTGKGGIGPESQPGPQTPLRGPRGVCFDRAGAVYVVDTSNHRVLRVPPAGLVETIAGNGAPGDAGDGGPARTAQLNQPSSCMLDSSGNLFLADTFSHRIRKVAPSGVISTVAGTGAASFSGDEGPATAATLNSPRGVTVDDGGNIFIADTGNQRIRQVTPDGAIHTIAGTGTPGYGGDDGPAAAALVNGPAGLFLDGAGNLYFADSGNDRVRRLVPERAVVAPPPAVTLLPPLTAVNAASMRQGPVAPGEMVVIYGEGLGPETGVAGERDASGLLPNLVAGVEARFDGVPAPIFYAQAGQVNVQAPYTLAGSGATHVQVLNHGNSAGSLDLAVAAANPALFPVIVNQDGEFNSQSTPAPRGTLVTLFGTGEGLTDGANISGMAAAAPYARPMLPVAVTVAGISAEIVYAGAAPGLTGELQVNARVPGGYVPPGPVAVELTIGRFTAPAVTMWVK